MLRSLFSGVSGVRNQQTQIDVIGNNIANVNTIGFKSSRVTFQDQLTQMLQSGTSPQATVGGKNPISIGQGSSLGTIDRILTQGTFESTDNQLDLAISGNAYFVLNDGEKQVYSRAGNFQVDSDGYLVFGSTGFRAAGRMANQGGKFDVSTAISDIRIPYESMSPAHATSSVSFTGNLNAEGDATAQVLTASYAKAPKLTSDAMTGSFVVQEGINDELEIMLNDGSSGNITETITLTADTYENMAQLVSEINSQIQANRNLAGRLEAGSTSVGDDYFLNLENTVAGGESSVLSIGGTFLAPTDPAADDMTFTTTESKGTETTTALSEIPALADFVTVEEDVFKIVGLDADGSTISAEFSYSPTVLDPTDPDSVDKVHTVQDLLDRINSTYSGVEASLSATGDIVMTDTASGETNTTISIGLYDSESSNEVTISSFETEVEGANASLHETTIDVYDSKGKTHTLKVKFTNISSSSDQDVWRWETTVDDGTITPSAGNTGFVKFSADGSLMLFETSDDSPLTFEPGGGSETVTIDLNMGEVGDFGGVTQFSSSSTLSINDQDGYEMGSMYDISFDETGKVVGYYTNGTIINIAQIAVATFQNPSGLESQGENVYTTGANTGAITRGWAGETIKVEITPGALELSNVDLTKEFTSMIIAQRAFQASSKLITTSDTLLETIVNLKR